MMNFPETEKKKECGTLLSLKPKTFHILALLLILSIAHSLVFLGHFLGIASDISSLVFWLNAVLLVLFLVAFLKLWGLNRHLYEISGTAVTETRGLLYREKRTLPINKVFGYRMNRSFVDHLLGTAHLIIVDSGGYPAIIISAADYAEARNAENLLDSLLLNSEFRGEMQTAAEAQEYGGRKALGVSPSDDGTRWWRNG